MATDENVTVVLVDVSGLTDEEETCFLGVTQRAAGPRVKVIQWRTEDIRAAMFYTSMRDSCRSFDGRGRSKLLEFSV